MCSATCCHEISIPIMSLQVRVCVLFVGLSVGVFAQIVDQLGLVGIGMET